MAWIHLVKLIGFNIYIYVYIYTYTHIFNKEKKTCQFEKALSKKIKGNTKNYFTIKN